MHQGFLICSSVPGCSDSFSDSSDNSDAQIAKRLQRRNSLQCEGPQVGISLPPANAENGVFHQEELKRTTEEADRFEFSCEEINKTLDRLKDAVKTLLKNIDCDATKIMEQLGDKGRVTDTNLFQYLGEFSWGPGTHLQSLRELPDCARGLGVDCGYLCASEPRVLLECLWGYTQRSWKVLIAVLAPDPGDHLPKIRHFS